MVHPPIDDFTSDSSFQHLLRHKIDEMFLDFLCLSPFPVSCGVPPDVTRMLHRYVGKASSGTGPTSVSLVTPWIVPSVSLLGYAGPSFLLLLRRQCTVVATSSGGWPTSPVSLGLCKSPRFRSVEGHMVFWQFWTPVLITVKSEDRAEAQFSRPRARRCGGHLRRVAHRDT